jgi:hypothetical protein
VTSRRWAEWRISSCPTNPSVVRWWWTNETPVLKLTRWSVLYTPSFCFN